MSTPEVKSVYIARGSDRLAQTLATRTLAVDGRYLVPYLEKLPPDFVFVDIGCGPASVSLEIAARWPRATVLGVDASDRDLKIAKELAEKKGIKNAFFTVGDALDLTSAAATPGFEKLKGGADFVSCNMVLMHTLNPARAISQMRSTLKPTGLLAVRETDPDLTTMYPLNEGTRAYLRIASPTLRASGSDPHMIAKLVHHVLAAGFKKDNILQADMGGMVSHTLAQRENWYIIVQEMIRTPQAAQVVADDEVGRKIGVEGILEGWREWVAAEDGWHGMATIELVVRNH